MGLDLDQRWRGGRVGPDTEWQIRRRVERGQTPNGSELGRCPGSCLGMGGEREEQEATEVNVGAVYPSLWPATAPWCSSLGQALPAATWGSLQHSSACTGPELRLAPDLALSSHWPQHCAHPGLAPLSFQSHTPTVPGTSPSPRSGPMLLLAPAQAPCSHSPWPLPWPTHTTS